MIQIIYPPCGLGLQNTLICRGLRSPPHPQQIHLVAVGSNLQCFRTGPSGRVVLEPDSDLVKWLYNTSLVLLLGLTERRRGPILSISWSCLVLASIWLFRPYSLNCSCGKKHPTLFIFLSEGGDWGVNCAMITIYETQLCANKWLILNRIISVW